MKGRDGRVGAPAADLLVCFPTRSHSTTLRPKPICSPARLESQHRRKGHQQLKRSGTRRGQASAASPLLWAVTKPSTENNEIAEPTSPKVTCAGQIKVRNKAAAASGSCKNWQSVMEEIERIHNRSRGSGNKSKKMGFKKEIAQFLACLRGLRFDFRCFGSFPGPVLTSEDDDDDDDNNNDEDDEDDDEVEHQFHRVTKTPVDDTARGVFGSASSSSSSSRTVFSKWFNMVLQEKPINRGGEERFRSPTDEEQAEPAPPPNALLLMRCRSAPAKGWVERRGGDEEEDIINEGNEEKKEKSAPAEDEKLNKDNLVVMRYDPDLYQLSSDIAKETWIVGRGDPFSRSRSWKR